MKRWRVALLVVLWIVAVGVMVYFAVPNSFRWADDVRQYQERMGEDAQQRAGDAASD